ncbi:MAG: 5-oxoprolinase/urea amidolyase family protein [Porticoccaceae bacterium]|nr:5-oxoprolinase/urea amidolyase family protein [Porticoccaceae bacterium]
MNSTQQLGLKVIKPGIFSLLQDSGRFGLHSIGLTTGGPLDSQSFRWANRLCHNSEHCAAIEITIGGLVLEAQIDCIIALTGADIPMTINQQPASLWQSHIIKAGDRIELGFANSGMRGYLAVAGGYNAEPSFDSISTVPREGLGGLHQDGKPLQAGDQLGCKDVPPYCITTLRLPPAQRPELPRKTAKLRVVLGYQQEAFSNLQKQLFFSTEYRITESSDRMGYRLQGAAIKPAIDGILSEGICLGAIQVPADGQPILLLRDRQTIGGYPKLGALLSLDIGTLAQLMPGDTVSFEAISIEQAHNLLHLAERNFRNIVLEQSIDVRVDNQPQLLQLSQQIEDLLVSRNPRGMQTLQAALSPGYFLRAAELILQSRGTILIGTGFPVDDTFETDGPLGAFALYAALEKLGAKPVLVCGAPLADSISGDYRVHKLVVASPATREWEAQQALDLHKPSLVISIERPGLTADNIYCNMRGEDISDRCASFDHFLNLASCPTIGIGDGGNEIGMGNLIDSLAELNIEPSITCCDELLVADVSNWAAHGLIALIGAMRGEDMLREWDNLEVLRYLSQRGSVDGVSRQNTLTEDSLESEISEQLILALRKISGFC